MTPSRPVEPNGALAALAVFGPALVFAIIGFAWSWRWAAVIGCSLYLLVLIVLVIVVARRG